MAFGTDTGKERGGILYHDARRLDLVYSGRGQHDGFTLCSDYCFNVNPFFSPEQFDEFIVPYLKEVIAEYRKMGYYTIKHTDGNIMPILKQMADCKTAEVIFFQHPTVRIRGCRWNVTR